MGIRACLSTAFAIGLVASAVTPASAADSCRLNQITSVAMSSTPDGRLLLDSTINGEPAKLLLDTASPRTLLDPAYVKSRNLPWRDDDRIQGYGLTGTPLSGFARVDSLTLGRLQFGTQPVAFSSVGDIAGHPAGIVANDELEAYDIEINPAAGRLNLFASDHCSGKVVYWANEYSRMPLYLTRRYQPQIQVTVDGQTLWAVIDTGMAKSTMRLAIARRLFGVEPGAADAGSHSQVSGVDGVKLDSFTHTFGNLTLDGITLSNTEMQVADIDVARDAINSGTHLPKAVNQPDMYIGMSLLSKLHMFISYAEPAFYFTLADRPKTD
jgi:predicted aspartyl protease